MGHDVIDFRAVFTTPPVLGSPLAPVRVTLPDGVSVTSDDDSRSSTRALGRPVTLASAAPSEPTLEEYWPDIAELAHRETVTDEAMPSTTFFDLATIHVLTTATINPLRELYLQGHFEVRRFRPNIVVRPENDDAEFVESTGWGENFGSATTSCSRSPTLPTLRHDHTSAGRSPQGQRDPAPAARHNEVHVGVYGEVRRAGRVQRGDTVTLGEPNRAVDISRRWWESCHRKARCRLCLLNVELRGAHAAPQGLRGRELWVGRHL